MKGSNGTLTGTLEGISPTLTYYAGIFPTGSVLSGAPINAGTYTVVAAFPGSTDYAAATSSPFTFAIAKATTGTTVVSSASRSGLGQSVTFTATVTVAKPGSGTPSGTVIFKYGNTVLGTKPLSGGQAVVTTTSLPAGSYTITASYAGDNNFIASSGTLNETIFAPTPLRPHSRRPPTRPFLVSP